MRRFHLDEPEEEDPTVDGESPGCPHEVGDNRQGRNVEDDHVGPHIPVSGSREGGRGSMQRDSDQRIENRVDEQMLDEPEMGDIENAPGSRAGRGPSQPAPDIKIMETD